ncbi:uncharacterized protein LOC143208395 isoform X1 [Lasioglossum baleicum]|uniref:uncharacterized protein LOC143208395 isoform X1 n=1 Tax=Lasioglossum baleicum TaxID=434251 RepID=UPI003FCE6E1F
MIQLSMLNVDKFVHTFIQNLGLRIEKPVCRNLNKITFIKYVDEAYRIKDRLLFALEKIKEINIQQNLDFSNERDVRYFIEEHTRLSDKLNSWSNRQILASHLKNINIKILQKVKARKRNTETMKKVEVKLSNKNLSCKRKVRTNLRNKLYESKSNVSPRFHRDTCKTNKCSKAVIIENNNTFSHDFTCPNSCKSFDISRTKSDNLKTLIKNNLTKNLIDVKKEVEMARKILWFHANDTEFLKRKLHVSLYISKNGNYDADTSNRIMYNQLLCHHAILCLIEPSDKAFVLIENDLSAVIKKYLLQGYDYHFECQRDSQNCFAALIILNQWAKVLVQHTNTTMMQTICGILGCNIHQILVLHNP